MSIVKTRGAKGAKAKGQGILLPRGTTKVLDVDGRRVMVTRVEGPGVPRAISEVR